MGTDRELNPDPDPVRMQVAGSALACTNCHDPVFVGAADPLEKAYRCPGCGHVLCALCKLEDSCCEGASAAAVQFGDPETDLKAKE